jgi:hypothetical protein
MSSDQKRHALPKSASDYLADPATRAAVDALLAVDADSLPPEVEWEELDDYFAARAVAELTRAEFAVGMHALWRAIWAPVIPTTWKMPDPEELVEEGQSVSTGAIWEAKSFSLFHERGDLALFTLVGLNRRRLTLAFSCERRGKPQIKGDLGEFTWRDDSYWDRWMLLTPGVTSAADGTLDVSELQAAAKLAIAAVEATPEPAKRASPAAMVGSERKSKPKATGRRKS